MVNKQYIVIAAVILFGVTSTLLWKRPLAKHFCFSFYFICVYIYIYILLYLLQIIYYILYICICTIYFYIGLYFVIIAVDPPITKKQKPFLNFTPYSISNGKVMMLHYCPIVMVLKLFSTVFKLCLVLFSLALFFLIYKQDWSLCTQQVLFTFWLFEESQLRLSPLLYFSLSVRPFAHSFTSPLHTLEAIWSISDKGKEDYSYREVIYSLLTVKQIVFQVMLEELQFFSN